MKKSLDNLFWSGVAIIFIPIIIVLLIFIVSSSASREKSLASQPNEIIERRIVYDTVRVEVKVPEVIITRSKKEKKKNQDTLQSSSDSL